MKNDLQQKVEDALQSLDGVQRAEANPFLYSRIKNRLHVAKAFVPQSLAWRMIAALVVIALMNVFTLQHVHKNNPVQSGAQTVASEYNISLPQTY